MFKKNFFLNIYNLYVYALTKLKTQGAAKQTTSLQLQFLHEL